MRAALIVSAEHASAAIPPWCLPWIDYGETMRQSHRGHDVGAAALAKIIGRHFDAPVFLGRVSRLCIDLNRSLDNPGLLSRASQMAPAAVRQRLINSHYQPFRQAVHGAITSVLKKNPQSQVLHLSVHSFAPVLKGTVRRADMGVLYDPQRPNESTLARQLSNKLAQVGPSWRVRRNYPYRGTADGHTTALRQQFGSSYSGIELEVNQRLVRKARAFRMLASTVLSALAELLEFERQFE